jgi:hypothetical protein
MPGLMRVRDTMRKQIGLRYSADAKIQIDRRGKRPAYYGS